MVYIVTSFLVSFHQNVNSFWQEVAWPLGSSLTLASKWKWYVSLKPEPEETCPLSPLYGQMFCRLRNPSVREM